MSRRTETILLFALMAGIFLSFASLARAKSCMVEGVITHTNNVHDLLSTPNSLWVASDGGVEEYDRGTHALRRKYTHLDGLTSLVVHELGRNPRGALVATLNGSRCELRGSRFVCEEEATKSSGKTIHLDYHRGHRITATENATDGTFVGTAGGRAFFDQHRLGEAELPGRHVTSLALHRGKLWVGTFNGGLAREGNDGVLRPIAGPGKLINALLAGPKHLFVGTSDGLYQTKNGTTFERLDFVENAVVGLAFDGTSVWASTPGALYRIRDGRGPASDVWWLPGGSRSLQKVSAVPGFLWLGTEDRGAIRMTPRASTMAKDQPFEVFDRGSGLASSWSLAVAARRDGSAWMTTLRDGAWLIGGETHLLALKAPISDWGLSALADGDGAWLGTQGGAAYVTASKATPIHRLPDARVHAFLKDERQGGRLWIGTENGLAWCRPTESSSGRLLGPS